jgi:hypothetical protein
MAANSALVVSDLDFETIRSNLVTFLSSQTRFKDYDFEGSNMAVLLDVLSYNTHMNNFYTNMAISEMFLDSAQLRDSVVSRAKELNYMPRSSRSATAYINIAITPNDTPSTITIPRGAAFTSRIENTVYTFTTADPIIVTASDNYTATNVPIYEGTYITERFQVDNTISDQRFILSNQNIDTSSIYITVQNSTTDTTNSEFIQATSLLGYNGESKIFFVQAADKSRYEIVFGDGIVGVLPINDNIINVSYRITKGSAANKATSFKPSSTIDGYPASNITITTAQAAYGGSDPETISSVKFNAPRHYQTQERAVTLDDYRTILLAEYPNIRAINVYGGESVYPPQYGKVFISIDLMDYTGVPDILKNSIQTFINGKMPISIEPTVVSAEYTYVDVVASASYNLNSSSKTENDIKNLIVQQVKSFNTQYLDNYNKTMRYSKLAAAVDGADSSILTSNLTTRMMKKISPYLSTSQLFNLDYQNSITEGTLISSTFTYNGIVSYLKDTGNAEVAIVTSQDDLTSTSGVKEIVLKHNVGTIDYQTGIASINVPELDAYTGDSIKIYATPVTNDFSVKNNTVIQIEDGDITVNVTATRA